MKKLFSLLFLLCCASAFGAGVERITLSIIVSNSPVTSNTLTINATTRTWTNTSSALYIPTNHISTALATTNLANNLAAFPLSPPLAFQWISSTNFRLIGAVGGALAASEVGGWAVLSLSTQSGPATFTAVWPMENMAGALSNRTNQASSFVSGLGIYSTNAFLTNSTAVSNHLHKGAGPRQRVLSEVEYQTLLAARFAQLTNANLVNATNRGYIAAITNGYWTNGIAESLTVTNLNSPGAGAFSQRLGANSSANGEDAVAIGQGATADTNHATVVGRAASAFGISDSAFGSGTEASGGSSVAIAVNALTGATNAIALGARALANHQNSAAIGADSSTTASNQILLGTSQRFVSIPGVLAISGTQTNTTFTGTNVLDGRLDFKSRANSSLVNGANSAIILGSNVFVRLSGATTVAGISGFAAEQDGSYHIVQFSGAITNVIVNEVNSTDIATDATAANRIVTGTGTNYYFTNSPLVLPFIYDASAARWKLSVPR